MIKNEHKSSYENIFEKLNPNRRVMIASHRGRYGGRIPQNTIESYQCAMNCGADIIEADVARSKDGKLILMHGPKVDGVTNGEGLIKEMLFEDLKNLRFVSAIHQVTDKRINLLDEVLTHFKDRCFINLDRCVNYLDEAFDHVALHKMVNQVVFKTGKPVLESIQWLKSRNYEPLFIPIIKDVNEIDSLLNAPKEARFPAVELVFESSDSPLIDREIINLLHEKSIKVWVNAIDLTEILSGGHTDTISILDNPNQGWGWLVDIGADIIQTDWVTELNQYLSAKGHR